MYLTVTKLKPNYPLIGFPSLNHVQVIYPGESIESQFPKNIPEDFSRAAAGTICFGISKGVSRKVAEQFGLHARFWTM